MAALSVQSASGAGVASGSEARSSEFAATPPTTAIRRAGLLRGLARALDECADDRALVRSGEVCAARVELLAEVADGVQQRRLHAREGEVEPGHARDGKRERLRVALTREPVDRRAAGIAEPEQARALVERLAGSVVECRAEDVPARVLVHVQQQRVPAAREQAEERRLERLRLRERATRRGRAGGRRGRAAAGETTRSPSPSAPDEQRADEARAARDCDVLTSSSDASASPSASRTTGVDELEVPARRDLRHDAAVARVQLRLRGDDAREHAPVGA